MDKIENFGLSLVTVTFKILSKLYIRSHKCRSCYVACIFVGSCSCTMLYCVTLLWQLIWLCHSVLSTAILETFFPLKKKIGLP